VPRELPQQTGHAVEGRLCAEDPANNFLPSTGILHVWRPPLDTDGIRVDSGVEEGTEIGVYYDPLLAKIIAHAADRDTAISKLVYVLKHFAAQGVETNREYLIRILGHEEFRSGRAHTEFQLAHEPADRKADDAIHAAVVRAYIEHTEHARRAILSSIPIRFRNNPYPGPDMKLEINGRECLVPANTLNVEVLEVKNGHTVALIDGIRCQFHIHHHGDEYYIRSSPIQRTIKRLPRYPRRAGAGQQQTANAPMPGQVLRVLVSAGQSVKLGDSLITLEAMKMEQTIKATIHGVVGAVLVKPGDIVAPGQMLVEIQSQEDANEHARSSAAKH
jgi:acetyl/propionyl-CoA carboxylase alpha subunit